MKRFLALMVLSSMAVVGIAMADTKPEGPAREAWIMGKLEATYALNPHLSAFAIDTDVKDGVVTLRGTVESDIDRDLAGEIAKGVDGVTEVNNQLQVATDVKAASGEGQRRQEFAQWVDDATTTAAVKTKLIRNENIRARESNVDTENEVVTLTGRVSSNEERQLAEQLARNTEDVSDVRNELVVAHNR
jgi:hyperosmotically inducible periplasmic protein